MLVAPDSTPATASRTVTIVFGNSKTLAGEAFLTGYSVIGKARESIGLGAAAERFGGTFFGNGSSFGGVFEHPGTMTPNAQKSFAEAINSRHQGVDRAHKFLVVEEGMKYQRLGIPPNDAQFLETRQFQVTEIARWFGLPPHKLGDLTRATFSNIEQQAIDYYTGSLVTWLTAWEQELEAKLIAPSERGIQVIEHVVEGLLRGDAQSRATHYAQTFQVGGITPNEIRALENRNPIDGGDRSFVPLNMIPVDRLDEWIDAQIAAKLAPRPQQGTPGADSGAAADANGQNQGLSGDDDEPAARNLEAFRSEIVGGLWVVLTDTLDRLVRREQERSPMAPDAVTKHADYCRTALGPVSYAIGRALGRPAADVLDDLCTAYGVESARLAAAGGARP